MQIMPETMTLALAGQVMIVVALAGTYQSRVSVKIKLKRPRPYHLEQFVADLEKAKIECATKKDKLK